MKTLDTTRSTAANSDLFDFTQGLDVDKRMACEEVQVQKAWVKALEKSGHITSPESKALIKTLSAALQAMEDESFDWQVSDEDIHMNLERYLTEKLGSVGEKVHLGRSRNDLVATTLRLFTANKITELADLTLGLAATLHAKGENWLKVIIPGLTHLQFGQPMRLSHVISAHGFAVLRDLERLDAAVKITMSEMPLGAGAFAGTHLKIDLVKLAKTLGFTRPANNSYDSVGDRDFMLESLNATALLAMHISRLTEEILFWSSTPIAVLKLPFDWSTGSSIMPNKRNPDVPEITRAKMARVIARAGEGLAIMRVVTPSYGSDLHELKRTFLSAMDEMMQVLPVLTAFLDHLEVNADAAERLLKKGHILATDLANASVRDGISFRDAYRKIAKLVSIAESMGCQVQETAEAVSLAGGTITAEDAVEARDNHGGTSLRQTSATLKTLGSALEQRVKL